MWLLCDWMSQVRDHKVSYKVMELVILCSVSLKNNIGHTKGQNASEEHLFDVKKAEMHMLNEGQRKVNARWASHAYA